MACAAYSEWGNAHVAPHAPCQPPHFVAMDVTVPSLQALRVRRALARCSGAGNLRCVPQPVDHLALLEVHLPSAMVAAVMPCVRGYAEDIRFGPVQSRAEHMAQRTTRKGILLKRHFAADARLLRSTATSTWRARPLGQP